MKLRTSVALDILFLYKEVFDEFNLIRKVSFSRLGEKLGYLERTYTTALFLEIMDLVSKVYSILHRVTTENSTQLSKRKMNFLEDLFFQYLFRL